MAGSKVSRRRILEVGGALAAMPAASQDKDRSAEDSGDDVAGLRRVRQELVDPPSVPRHDQVAPGAR